MLTKTVMCSNSKCEALGHARGDRYEITSRQAYVWSWKDQAMSNSTCDINNYEEVPGMNYCHCDFYELRCPDTLSVTAKIGSPGDIIAAPFYLSGALSIVATVIFFYILTLKPLAKMKENNKKEVEKWENVNHWDGKKAAAKV